MNKLKCRLFILSLIMLSSITLPIQKVSAVNALLESQQIGKVEVIIATDPYGTDESLAQRIKAKLKTREGDIFSQTAFDNDLKTLVRDYDHVEPLIESADGKILITLKVWPKPTIRSMTWEGNVRIKTSRIESELGIHSGSIFDRQAFNKAFHQVKAYYIKKGFFEAQLDYEIRFDETDNVVDIVVRIDEGRAGKIKSIVFRNFSKCEQDELLEMMVTKTYNFFLSWITGQGIYNEEMIQHDEFIVLNYLQNHGYADALVSIEVCEAKETDRIVIVITATKGARYYFGDISIEGNTIFSTEELQQCLKVCPGDPYSPDGILHSMQSLNNKYGRCGYIEAFVNYEPHLSPDQCVYDINITIDEGEQYHVGMIKVMGNCSTQTKVILHETLLVPGEVFNLEKLKLTEARLCNIGYFKHVNVYAVKSEECSLLPGNYRDVHIEVEEANTGHLGAFFGFSTVENMFGGINLTERNFNIAGLSRVWSDGMRVLRGGGEYAHLTLSIGTKTTSYALSWTKPYFNDTPWSVGFDLERGINKYIADDYEIKSYSFTLHATYQCNPFLRVGTHYRLKYSDVDIDDDDDGDDDEKKHRRQKERRKAERNDGLISAVGLSWNYDSTNHPLKPTCGVKSRIEGEVAGLGGDRSFITVSYLNSYFYDLWGYGILKLRGDLRFLQPLGETNENDVPLDERFFLGGDNTVRGYRSYRLGPKLDGDDEDPEGGISMQLFSLEYIKPVFSCLDLFVFADTGSLSNDKWNFGKYYHSIGYGARVKIFENTPPLTVGMGYPLNPRDSSDVKRFFITVGGKF